MPIDRQKLVYAARRILDSRADAEDALQDTFLRAFHTFSDWRTPEAGWMIAVLRNIAIDRRRRLNTECKYADRAPTVEPSEAPQWQIRAETEAAIRHLLSRVSAWEGASILLRDVFELDYREIADLLNKSESATRQILHRARVRARDADGQLEVERSQVEFFCRAIEAREPALLATRLGDITASVQNSPPPLHHGMNARSSSVLVQVNGRYALALVLDGVVLCVVPVGTQTMPSTEAA